MLILFHFVAGLGEFRIRDLNDEINKLLREKRHWENQISALGGRHFRRYAPRVFQADGREVPGNRGYKYFGAAKNLPGVRELFEQEPPPPPRKTRAELMKDVDAEYYGYRDDDDGLLIPLEEKAERIAIRDAVQKWEEKVLTNKMDNSGRKKKSKAKGDQEGTEGESKDSDNDDSSEEENNIYPISLAAREAIADAKQRILGTEDDQNPMQLLAPKFVAHVPVPSQKDIQEAFLRKRKQELLEKYCSAD